MSLEVAVRAGESGDKSPHCKTRTMRHLGHNWGTRNDAVASGAAMVYTVLDVGA